MVNNGGDRKGVDIYMVWSRPNAWVMLVNLLNLLYKYLQFQEDTPKVNYPGNDPANILEKGWEWKRKEIQGQVKVKY